MKTYEKESEVEELNKTIVITREEGELIRKGCLKEEAVSREFLDWYLTEETFFSKKGIMVVENIISTYPGTRLCFSYDFTNPDVAIYCLYQYEDQHPYLKFRFIREQNLTFSGDLNIVMINLKVSDFERHNKTLMGSSLEKKPRQWTGKTSYNNNSRKELLSQYAATKKKLDKMMRHYAQTEASMAILFSYAIMYQFSKNRPKEVSAKERGELVQGGLQKIVMGIYKYTGYVNLSESKIYKSPIKRDPNTPAREYERHIEKWSVRGHYRRTSKGLIWIDEHERGEGILENRVYGITPEEEHSIIPKVFEVERTVTINSNQSAESSDSIPTTTDSTPMIAVPIVEKKAKQSYVTRLFNKLKSWWK